jgi:hypothetical protein
LPRCSDARTFAVLKLIAPTHVSEAKASARHIDLRSFIAILLISFANPLFDRQPILSSYFLFARTLNIALDCYANVEVK